MKIKTKIALVGVLGLFFQTGILHAQESVAFKWAKNMGGTSSDGAFSVTTDINRNVYTAGRFFTTADFDPGPGTYNLTAVGANDIFVSKLDEHGNFVWAKAMGGPNDDWAYDVATDAAGNVYLTGPFNTGTADFDPGPGVFNMTSLGSYDIFIVKLNSDGVFQWAKQMGGTGNDGGGKQIEIDVSGNIYTTGIFLGTVDFDPGAGVFNHTSTGVGSMFVSKLDGDGNFVWAQKIGGVGASTYASGNAIETDAAGNVYATGIFEGTVDFDPGVATVFNQTSAGQPDIFVMKLDAAGTFVWAKRVGNTLNDESVCITLDPADNVLISGGFDGTVDFDPGAGIFNLSAVSAPGFFDIFVLKLDSNGNFAWAKAAGGSGTDYISGITTDPAGNVYVAGEFESTVDFDPDANRVFNLTSTGNRDVATLKLDNAGNFVWATRMGGTSSELARDIALDNRGNIYTAGFYLSAVGDYDPTPGLHTLPLPAGQNEIFVSKISTYIPQIVNTFDATDQGWTTEVAATPPSPTPIYSSTGGNPGGMISAQDLPAGAGVPYSYFIAPASYLGDKCSAYGKYLRVDLQQSINRALTQPFADVIISNGSTTLYFFSLPTYPSVAPAWTTYNVPLNEITGQWKTGNSSTAGTATKDQIKSVLCNLTLLKVRGRYGTTPDGAGSLDNAILESQLLLPAPVITSFTPASGTLATPVTINGTGFGATVPENVVHFGSTRATVTTASPTQLVVTVPGGALYGPITVINKTTGLEAQSLRSFNPIFDDGGRIIPASLDPKIDILLDPTGGNNIVGLAIADLDGDGWSDVLAAENGINNISIYRNLGAGGNITAGSFAARFPLTGAGNGGGLRALDLDGDGKLDIACGYTDGVTTFFATYRNTSSPDALSFEAVEFFPGLVYSGPLANAIDVDGDGRIDLIGQHINGSAAPDFWIARNISSPGNIEFATSVSYFGSATLDAGAGVNVGDLDNDGKPEMVVKFAFGAQFQIIKNNSVPGAISFGTPFPIAQGSTGSIVLADFNLDGKNDLAWKNGNSNDDVRIRLNTNSGGALAAADFATEVVLDCDLTNYGDLSISDINGDTKPDILLTDHSNTAIFENIFVGGALNSSAFIKAYVFPGAGVTTYPTPILAGDLNGDQRPDVLIGVTNISPARISIYENKNVHAPEISLSTVSPLKGTVGTTVTITGDYFSSVPAENVVHFGAARATVLTASKTMLTVTVPAGATYAPVSVTRNELTARYHLPFDVTFSTGVTFNASSFGTPVDFNLVSPNLGIDVGDLNGDNKPDILVEANGSFGIPQSYAFKNTHTSGSISTSSLVPDDTTNTTAQVPKLIDLNGDNKPDIASVSGIYRNSSPGAEVQFDVLTATGGTTNIAFADFNHDGKTDYTGISGGSIAVHENRTTSGPFAAGTFPSIAAAVTFAKPAAGGASAVADFDNDGFADMAATNPGTDNFTVWRNNGGYIISTAMFTNLGNITTGANPSQIYTGDLDVDGKVDLFVIHGAGTSAAQLSVFHNQTTGSISFARQDFAIGAAGGPSTIADLDGDGKPEIIVICPTPTNTFIIFKNTAIAGVINASSFAAPAPYPLSNPRMVATADINLDGKLDLIFTRTTVNLLTVMENLIPSSSISYSVQPAPTTVCEGISAFFSVTATGDNNLQYLWQVDNGGFVNLSNDATYSGVNTATLTISNPTTALNGKQYRVLVHGDVTPDNPSSSAVLTVNPSTPPVTTGNSGCALTSISVFASGGLNGQYRWYNAATGGTAITGEVNNTYNTPPLTTTTSYFVSINNGSCESTRMEVVATVVPGPSAPAATGASRCSTGMVTLTASGSTNGNYRWYNVATGGTALTGEVNSSFTTPSLTATTPYYVSISNGTCESSRATALATINTPPTKPVITANLPINSNQIVLDCSIVLTLSAPTGFSSYLWSTGATTQQITVTLPGPVSVQVTDANGCTSVPSDELSIIALALGCNLPPFIAPDTVATQIGGDIKLDLDILIGDPDGNLDLTSLRVVIQPTSGAVATINANRELIIDYSGIAFSGIDKVTIEVCDALGSCTQQVITIEVVGDITIYNAISPNGDGQNEFLILEYIEIIEETSKNRVTIFNRWGDRVFEITNYNNTTRVFSGLNHSGNELPSGTYFYRIDFAGSRKSKTGFLTLKR